MTKRKKHHRYTALILLSIFGVFLAAASEDRTFKNWKSRNLSLLHEYKDLEYFCHRDLNSDEDILLDLSILLNVNRPFDNQVFGPFRRSLYFRNVTEIRESFYLLIEEQSGILIARTGEKKKFEFINKQSFEDFDRLDRKNIPEIRDFMFEHNIKYYVCYYEPYGRAKKKNLLEGFGFSLVYYNVQFMLFNVLK